MIYIWRGQGPGAGVRGGEGDYHLFFPFPLQVTNFINDLYLMNWFVDLFPHVVMVFIN